MSPLSRRDLLAAAGVTLVPVAAGRERRRPEQAAPSVPVALPVRELRDRYRRDLFDDYLPFIDRFVFDHDLGGFMCEVKPSGARVTTSKSVWFDGRGAWVCAFLYNRFGRDPRQLEMARKTVDLLLRVGPSDPDGLWPKTYTHDGTPLLASGGEIYGDLFVAEALQEYAAAAGDRRYLRMARDLLLKCEAFSDRADYRPMIGQTYLGPDARPIPGARILGVWMVLLRVATQMLEKQRDAEVERVADRAIEAIFDRHLNPAFDLLNELLEHDFTRPANEYAQLVYTGHAIELLWMVLQEAIRRGDDALFARATALYRRHLEVAWDDVYGGVFRNLQHVDRNQWLVDKVLWAQEEALIGTLLVVERTGAAWAQEAFARIHRYVTDTYPLRARGRPSPLWMYAGDRAMTLASFDRMPARVENYHHPRHLMLNLLALDRLAAR